MKRYLMIMASLVFVSTSASAQSWKSEPTPNDTLHSIVLKPDGSVDFQIYAPKASNVTVSGDVVPFGSTVPFTKNKDGVWKGNIPNVGAGVGRYAFVVDGLTVLDPKSDLAGETRNLLEITPTGDEFFAMKDVPHGAIAQRYYYSKALGTMRRLHVWTPAGFEKSTEKLPVLYLIHGGGDTDISWPTVGAAGRILDNLLAEGKMAPMVVVMPNGTIDVDDEVPVFAEDMLSSIIPFIEDNYDVLTDSSHRAVAGLSMGGMETMEVAFTRPDLFSYVWVLSSSFKPFEKPADEAARLKVKENASLLNSSFKELVYTEGGKEDIAYENCINTRALLDAAGVKYEYLENAQTGHSWATWKVDLFTLAQRIFR